MFLEEMFSIPIDFDSELTRDHHQVCARRFYKYLPTHSHNTTTYQNTVVQLIFTEFLISFTSQSRNFSVNPISSPKLQPLDAGRWEIMRCVTEVI